MRANLLIRLLLSLVILGGCSSSSDDRGRSEADASVTDARVEAGAATVDASLKDGAIDAGSAGPDASIHDGGKDAGGAATDASLKDSASEADGAAADAAAVVIADPTPATWSQSTARAFCIAYERCHHPHWTHGFYDGEPCEAYFARVFQDSFDVPTLMAKGRLAWNASALGSCLTEVANATCANLSSRVDLPCIELLGAGNQGAACASSAECATNVFCKRADGERCGHCALRSTQGMPCAYDLACAADLVCNTGVACADASVSGCGSCELRYAQGTACDQVQTGYLCAKGLVCEPSASGSFSGTCQPFKPLKPAPAGSSCMSVSNTDVCQSDTRCRPTKLGMRSGQPFAQEECAKAAGLGEACLRADTVPVGACDDALYCDAANLQQGKCRPRVAAGLVCASDNPQVCALGSVCSGGTCAPRKHSFIGEPCTARNDCYSNDCNFVAGKCVLRLSVCE